MGSSKKICHFTSAHDPFDDRIFLKECTSLADAGNEVYLVAKGTSCEKNGVHLIGCGDVSGRIRRFLFFAGKVYREAKKLDCDIYHFHDPDLLPYGLKLKKAGKTVIFDSHEDVPAQILDKYWIPSFLRGLISKLYKRYETHVVNKLDVVVAATQHIAAIFKGRAKEVIIINNYPRLDDIVYKDIAFSEREDIVCYVGGISEIRGEKIMLEAIKGVKADLVIAGYHDKVSFSHGMGSVKYIGMLTRDKVNELYQKAKMGLCLLLPAANNIDAMPAKLFEYMAAGIPFIATDFPGWKKIAEESQAGVCVNLNDVDQITGTIKALLNDPIKAREMGRKGRSYVTTRCNWSNEEAKLIDLYKEL